MKRVVEQTPATPAEPASGQTARADGSAAAGAAQPRPGFVARGRLRRRARFLRKARELAYRDLGGLVFSLHRFGQQNDALVLAKLSTLGQIDTELRALESALQEPQPITVLREAGITACARCAAIHSSEDRFCPNCGLPLSRRVDLPVAGPAAAPLSAQQPLAPAQPGGSAAAWLRAAARPQSPPLPQGPPVAGQQASSAPPAGSAPQSAGFTPPPASAAPAPMSAAPAARPPAAPVAAQTSRPAAEAATADDAQNTEVFGRPSLPDDEQPTEITRPSQPPGS
jgi:hypothetical protein